MKPSVFGSAIVALSLLAPLGASADCGCEANALLRLTYVERGSGETKEVYAIGKWWIRGDSVSAYVHGDRVADQIMAGMAEEILFFEHLARGSSYLVVRPLHTQPISIPNGETYAFQYITPTEDRLSFASVRSVAHIEELRVGCTAHPSLVAPEDADLFASQRPFQVDTEISPVDGDTIYKLRFRGGTEDRTLTIWPQYEGCL